MLAACTITLIRQPARAGLAARATTKTTITIKG
jgi:hypothetical protein